jgi:iron complex transport system substrate-binding protein
MNNPLESLTELRRVPKRIVCIAPSNTEILYELGAQDRIVGVSRYCDWPPEAASKPRVGGFQDPAIDSILELAPDLVLAQSFLQQNAVKALADHEVRVLCFSCTSLAELLADILLLGRIVEKESSAKSLVTAMHEELEALAGRGNALAAKVGRRPRVHLEEWGPSEPYYLAGDWAAEMLIVAGADNAFDDRKLRCRSRDRVVTADDIAAHDPDIIITAWCGCNEKVDLGRVAQRPALRDTRVVRDQWLRMVDDRFVMRPGPRIVEGVRRLQTIIEEWGQSQQA